MLSPPIIAVDDVSVGYDPKHPVLNRVTLRIDTDDRIALLGSNGNGKSTLVKLLANRLPPFSGRVTRAEKLSVGYFAQHQVDELNLDGSPYDHVRKLMPEAPETKVRGRTGAIGFSGKAGDTLVRSLSGGEKARLLLGLATFFGPNMIILDEPTNHLDIDSRAALAEAINEFPGAVIMVSHDRYLIEACADQLWVVADHAVTTYDGDLDDYRRMVLSTRGMRANSRDRARARRRPRQAAAQQGRKARAAEAEDFKRRGRNRRASTASSPRSIPRWRCRTCSSATRNRRPSSAKRAPARQAHCCGRRKNGWWRVRSMTKRPAEPVHATPGSRARHQVAAGFFFGLDSCRLCRLPRLRVLALDRRQATSREGIDSGARPARIIDDRDPVAARVVRQIDAVRRADAAHDVAFGMTQRHGARWSWAAARRPRPRSAHWHRQARRQAPFPGRALGTDQILGGHRLVRRQRRRFNRDIADRQPAGARKPVGILRQKIRRNCRRARSPRQAGPNKQQRQQRCPMRNVVPHDNLSSRPCRANDCPTITLRHDRD